MKNEDVKIHPRFAFSASLVYLPPPPHLFRPTPPPPLCKGRWLAAGKTEGLLFSHSCQLGGIALPTPLFFTKKYPFKMNGYFLLVTRGGIEPPIPP